MRNETQGLDKRESTLRLSDTQLMLESDAPRCNATTRALTVRLKLMSDVAESQDQPRVPLSSRTSGTQRRKQISKTCSLLENMIFAADSRDVVTITQTMKCMDVPFT